MGYADQIVICAVEDNEAPVIDVDDTVINVKVGEAFDIPVATVTDNVDKDLTEKVNVGRDDAKPERDFFFNTGALADDTDYYFAVQMKYVYTDASQTRVKAIDVSMWFGSSEDGLSAVEKTFGGAAVTGEAGYLNVSAMSTAQITSNGILILPSPAGTNTMTVTGIRAELA